jgi:hypothetical protein
MATYNVYHPEYGFHDAFRMAVCKTAFTLGKKAAAKKHGVSMTSIYNWTKVYTFEAVMRDDKTYIVRGDGNV